MKHSEQYNELALEAYQTNTLLRSAMKQIEDLPEVGSAELFDIDTLLQIASERLESAATTASEYSHAAYGAKQGKPTGDKVTSIDGKGGAS